MLIRNADCRESKDDIESRDGSDARVKSDIPSWKSCNKFM